MNDAVKRHVVAVVGGGAAGLTVAALLKARQADLDVAVIEPSECHSYQPAWTLVGGGAYDLLRTRRATADCLPAGVTWIRDRVSAFAPEQNRLTLASGATLEYRYLVVAAGLQLDWSRIDGLEATLGKNGVTSNYRYDLAPYTWDCIRGLRGGAALFTQPAMPIKCAGAPQKILYLAADHCRRQRIPAGMHFFTPGPAMFGVPFYAKALDQVVADYGIQPHFGHNLVAVDGPGKRATFEVGTGDEKRHVELGFDLLHVVPPQSAPDFIKASPLADASGWMSVDRHSLRHTTHENVFGLGDCTTTPNSKTAAAVRAQAPVVAANLLHAMHGRGEQLRYDGYASCPLTTSNGRIMLAEFLYDGVVAPSFPADPRIPRRAYWWLKKHYLPHLYWRMLKGHLGQDWHRERSYPETLPRIIP
ncbi:MAG TPA: FAD/NAD(P)-binding oxidoreductase [Porticoccaceae bacterium]|nr:FAD/NAD(P)-binding oxidoreductase [Porticoccaceae bacterium]